MASADESARAQAMRKDVTSRCQQIFMEDISMEKDVILGSGAFGTVHRGCYRGVINVAVKVIDRRKYSEGHKQEILACKEARSMCAIEHKAIVKLYGIILEEGVCGLVLEFMEHGSLSDLLTQTNFNGSPIPISIQVDMMKDISEAMRFLHGASPSLVHADLKLGNILIDNDFKAKLGDFGVSTLHSYTSDRDSSAGPKGTLSHMAPELFEPAIVRRNVAKNSRETDVWSFGVLLFELMKGESPFKGLPQEAIKHQLRGLKDHCLSELNKCKPSVFIKLVSACLEYEPTKRTDFEIMASLLHDEFIGKYKQFYLNDLKTLTGILNEVHHQEDSITVTDTETEDRGDGEEHHQEDITTVTKTGTEDREGDEETVSVNKVAQMRQMLTCPICSKQFTDPISLPCIHTFCETCLAQHMAEKGDKKAFTCPTCKAKYTIPKDGVSGFKRNIHLFNLGQILPKDDGCYCNFCKSDGRDAQATSVCTECHDRLCEACAKSHRRHTKNHQVVVLKEVKSGQHFQEIRHHQKVYCPVHPDKVLEIYCKSCEVPVCYLCNLHHNKHKVTDIRHMKEAAKNAGEVLSKLFEPWRDVLQHAAHWVMVCEKSKQILQGLQKKSKHILQGLQQQQNVCEAQIKQLYSRCQTLSYVSPQEVKKHEQNVIDQLNKKVEEVRKQAEFVYDESEGKSRKFSLVLLYVNSILESAHDAEILQYFKEIKSLLEKLNISEIKSLLEKLNICQMELQLEKTIIKLQPEEIVIPDFPVNIVTESENENISSKFSEKLTLDVSASCKSPVHLVTPQPAVKEHVRLMRRFSSLREGEERGWCWGLAVGDGVLVVTDRLNKNVKVFDKNDFTFKFMLDQTQHQLQYPVDVTCNKLGHIFITDRGIHGVVKYDTEGRLMKVYPGLYKGDWGFITCHNDQLIVADRQGGRVMFTDFECKVHHQIDGRSLGLSKFSPCYVCVDENSGHLVVGQWGPDCVYVIDHTKSAVIHTYSDKLGRPRSVCVDQFGNILLADCSPDRVTLLTPARAHVIATRGDVYWPTAICVTGPGQVAVLERDSGTVKEFRYLNI